MSNSQTYKNIKEVQKLLTVANIPTKNFFLSIASAAISVGLHLLELCLLIPLIRGLIQQDFSFLANTFFGVILHRILGISPTNHTLIFLALLTLIFTIGITGRAFAYFSNKFSIQQAKISTLTIRQVVMERYLNFGKLFFDRNSVAKLQGSLTYFSNAIATRLQALQSIFTELSKLFIYLLVMLFISWQLTIIFLIVFLSFYSWAQLFFQKINSRVEEHKEVQKDYNQQVYNTLISIPLIKSYANETKEAESFRILNQQEMQKEYSIKEQDAAQKSIQEMFMLVALLVMVSTMHFVATSQGNLAAYFVFFYVVRMSVPRFNMIAKHKRKLEQIRKPLSNVLNVLEQSKDKFVVVGGMTEFTGLKEKISFRDLNFTYKEKLILDSITFSLKKNQMTAIVGHSGAGKTTIASLLLRFYSCPENSIFIDGKDINQFTTSSLMSHISLVEQDTILFHDTLKNNITYGIEISSAKLEAILEQSKLKEVITNLPEGLETTIGDRGVQLSGGERQRVAIARALVKNTEILVLDEATSSLDSHTQSLIQEIIDDIRKDHTIIVIAHHYSTIEKADKIVVLESGKVVEEGNFTKLVENKQSFYHYWQLQNRNSVS